MFNAGERLFWKEGRKQIDDGNRRRVRIRTKNNDNPDFGKGADEEQIEYLSNLAKDILKKS